MKKNNVILTRASHGLLYNNRPWAQQQAMGIKYLFSAHPNVFGQKNRILKNQIPWSNSEFRFTNLGNFLDLQLL